MYQLYKGTNPFEWDLEEIFSIDDKIFEQLFLHPWFHLNKFDEQDTVTIFNAEISIVLDYLRKAENLPKDSGLKDILTQTIQALIITKNEGKDFFVLHFA